MFLLINLVLLVAGIVIVITGLATVRADPFNWLIVALGAAVLGLAFYLDRGRVRQRDARAAADIAERTAALTQRHWQLHERLEVPQNLWLLVLAVGMTLVGGWMAQHGFTRPAIVWPLALGGLFFLAIGGLLLPQVLAGIGRPALVLDRKGLLTPIDGQIAWQHVAGIHLQVVESRGVKNYALLFRVPDYASVVQAIHWSQHWLALFGLGALRRGQIGVPLRPGKERPETIEAVARHLWKSATGREYVWNPLLSADANDSLRQLATLRKAMDVPADFERELKENPAQAMERMEQAMGRMEQFRRHVGVINDETKKTARKLNWVVGLVVLGMALALLWPWLKRW